MSVALLYHEVRGSGLRFPRELFQHAFRLGSYLKSTGCDHESVYRRLRPTVHRRLHALRASSHAHLRECGLFFLDGRALEDPDEVDEYIQEWCYHHTFTLYRRQIAAFRKGVRSFEHSVTLVLMKNMLRVDDMVRAIGGTTVTLARLRAARIPNGQENILRAFLQTLWSVLRSWSLESLTAFVRFVTGGVDVVSWTVKAQQPNTTVRLFEASTCMRSLEVPWQCFTNPFSTRQVDRLLRLSVEECGSLELE